MTRMPHQSARFRSLIACNWLAPCSSHRVFLLSWYCLVGMASAAWYFRAQRIVLYIVAAMQALLAVALIMAAGYIGLVIFAAADKDRSTRDVIYILGELYLLPWMVTQSGTLFTKAFETIEKTQTIKYLKSGDQTFFAVGLWSQDSQITRTKRVSMASSITDAGIWLYNTWDMSFTVCIKVDNALAVPQPFDDEFGLIWGCARNVVHMEFRRDSFSGDVIILRSTYGSKIKEFVEFCQAYSNTVDEDVRAGMRAQIRPRSADLDVPLFGGVFA